jgi:hypothetical protein
MDQAGGIRFVLRSFHRFPSSVQTFWSQRTTMLMQQRRWGISLDWSSA